MNAQRKSLLAEAFTAAVCLAVLCFVMRDALFLGRGAASHDNLYWLLPIYHYFAGSLLNGSLPLWNPFSHAGEPFYPMILHLRLMDPATFLTLAVGQFFTRDLITLANWHLLVLSLVTAFGAYLLLRQWCDHLVLRLALIVVLLWSSFLLVSFRQNGMVFQCMTVPYALYFLFRILDGGAQRWGHWVGLALAVGFSLQSYFFVAVLTAGFFFVVAVFCFHRAVVIDVLKRGATWLRLATFVVLVLGMLGPDLVMLLEKDDYSVSAREVDFDYLGRQPLQSPPQFEPGPQRGAEDPVVMPFSLIRYTGSFGSPWDFAMALAPEGNREVGDRPAQRSFGYPSEALFYFGMLVFVVALYGFLAGRHLYKRLWAFLGVGFGLLFLGPAGGLFWLLYQFFPPAWFNRHTHHYIDVVALALLYFFVVGGNALLAGRRLQGPAFDGLLARLFGGEGVVAAFLRGVLRPEPLPPTAVPPGGLRGRSDLIAFLVYLLAGLVVGHRILAASVQPAAVDALPGALPWIGVWIGMTLVLRRDLGRQGLFVALLAIQLILLLGLARDRLDLLFDLGLFLLLPLLLAWLLRRWRGWSVQGVAWLLVAAVCADLFFYLSGASRLWTAPRPDLDPQVTAAAEAPRWPRSRNTALFAAPELRPPGAQVPRYLEVMARQAAAFTPVMLDPQEDAAYFASKPLPGWQHLEFRPARQGAGVELVPAPGGGFSDAFVVHPRADGGRHVEVPLGDLPDVGPDRLWLAVWVKSGNSAREAVTLSLVTQAGMATREVQSVGGWSRIIFEASGAGEALLCLTLADDADGPVRLSHLEASRGVPGAPLVEDALLYERVFEGRRWNSSIVPKRFQDLVYADLDITLRQRLLSLGRPLIEFHAAAAVILSDDPWAELAALPAAKARARLDESLYLEPRAGPLLAEMAGQPGRPEAATFTVEVVDYTPNRLVLDVAAPAPGFLYLAETQHRAWRAEVDGSKRPVLLANGHFKAVPLKAGKQEVVLAFRPWAFVVAATVFWLLPLLAMLLLALGRVVSRPSPAA